MSNEIAHRLLKLLVFSSSFILSVSFGCPPPERLRRLLQSVENNEAPILLLPCCYDGLTARLVGLSGFDATFMTGFGVSGVNGYPDTQLVSFDEMVKAANTVAEGLSSAALEQAKYGEVDGVSEPVAIPCIADGDTGYGNAVNCKRTVFGYARAGTKIITYEVVIINDFVNFLVIVKSLRYGWDHD